MFFSFLTICKWAHQVYHNYRYFVALFYCNSAIIMINLLSTIITFILSPIFILSFYPRFYSCVIRSLYSISKTISRKINSLDLDDS